jgi:hypothetical protein
LVIFLLVNAVLAVYIATNYFIKSLDDSKLQIEAKKVVSTSTQIKATQVLVKPNIVPEATSVVNSTQDVATSSVENSNPSLVTEPANSAYKFPTTTQNSVANISASNQAVDSNKVCVEMGPLNAEEKSTMDFILAKNKQTDLAKIEKLQSHQLFWNLGRNKSEAEKLFSKQKEGAMANPKFVLVQNQDKDWVVNITKVHGSEDVAKKLAKDLEDKAQKINAGGTWQYSTLPEGYFYKFNDFKSLKEVTINSIDIMLKVPKDPC